MNFKHWLAWAVTSPLNRSPTVLLIFNFYLLKTAMKSYSESHAITGMSRNTNDTTSISNTVQESRRVTAQNVLMTYAKLLLSDSSSSSPVPSSWNNHKLTRVLTVERQCGVCMVTLTFRAVQPHQCKMLNAQWSHYIKKQFVFAFLRAKCADLSKPRFTTGWLCLQ